MGLLSNIAAIALKPSEWIASGILSLAEKVSGNKYGRYTAEEASKTTAGKVLGTAIAGTATALTAAAAGAGSIGAGIVKIATTIVKHPVKSAGTALVATTVLQSTKATKVVTELPEQTAKLTTNVAELIDDPSLSKVKDVITESPVAATIVAGVTALGLGSGITETVAKIMNTQATRENTLAIQSAPSEVLPSSNVGGTAPQQQIVKETIKSTESSAPTTPAVVSLTKKKRKSTKKRYDPMRTSIKIININDNRQTKKYLNRAMLIR